MPLTQVDFATVVRWALEEPVTGWSPIRQGENVLSETLRGIDLAEWDEVYAAKLPITGGATTTIDLSAVANLAGEAFGFALVFALAFYVTATVAGDTDCPVTLGPGASNGLDWFYGAGLTLADGEHVVKSAKTTFAGVTVDGTHKTLDLTNGGADGADVTIVILGQAA